MGSDFIPHTSSSIWKGVKFIAGVFQPLFDNHPEIELLAWCQWIDKENNCYTDEYSVLVNENNIEQHYVDHNDTLLAELFGKYRWKVWIKCENLRSPTWQRLARSEEVLFPVGFWTGDDCTRVFLRRDMTFGVYRIREPVESVQRKEALRIDIKCFREWTSEAKVVT
jgi:hypothetical protein